MRLIPQIAGRVHLAKAQEYWRADRLDLARRAMEAALREGVEPSDIYDLQRTIEAESAMRQSAPRLRIGEHLALEAHPDRWRREWRWIHSALEEAFQRVTGALRVHWAKPVLVTLFPDPDWVDFLHARFGYYADRTEVHKVCLPPDTAIPRSRLVAACCHEMTHAAAHQAAGESLPRWLDEGLAVTLEGTGPRPPASARSLGRMRLEELSGHFEGYEMELDSRLADACYRQAGELAALLIHARGVEGILRLLRLLGEGTRFDRAFEQVYGMRLRVFELEWLRAA